MRVRSNIEQRYDSVSRVMFIQCMKVQIFTFFTCTKMYKCNAFLKSLMTSIQKGKKIVILKNVLSIPVISPKQGLTVVLYLNSDGLDNYWQHTEDQSNSQFLNTLSLQLSLWRVWGSGVWPWRQIKYIAYYYIIERAMYFSRSQSGFWKRHIALLIFNKSVYALGVKNLHHVYQKKNITFSLRNIMRSVREISLVRPKEI